MKKTVIAILVVVVVGALLLEGLDRSSDKKTLRTTGRVELDEVIISTEVPGKVLKILVKEGQKVNEGDPLAEIDNESLSIQARVLKRQIEAKEEALRAYYRELEFTKVKAQSSVSQAQASVEIARNRLKEAEAEFNRRKAQMQRFKNLSEKGVSPKERFEEIQKVYLQAKEQLKAAQAALQAEEARLQEAKALTLKTKALQAKIKAMDKEILSLKAQLQRIKLDIKKTVIRAPSDGIVYRKLTEEGEVLGPMGPVFVLLKPRSL
ncbi:MAG: biotin/lipoyl-binding protein, partial [Nitrospirae bacterium]